MHQQLARASGVGNEVRRRRRQGTDVRADQVELGAAHHHVGLADLRAAAPDRLDLPAVQRDPRLVALLDEIIVGRLAVVDYGHEEF